MWNPLTPCSMISSGPPKQVAKVGKPADHRFDHGQPECLEDRWLYERATAVRDKTVELTAHHPIDVAHPAHLTVELVLVHQLVHTVDFCRFFGVSRVFGVHETGDDKEVRLPAQPVALTEPLREPGEVFDPVQPSHRKNDRLVGILELAACVRMTVLQEPCLELRLEAREAARFLRVRESRSRDRPRAKRC